MANDGELGDRMLSEPDMVRKFDRILKDPAVRALAKSSQITSENIPKLEELFIYTEGHRELLGKYLPNEIISRVRN